MIGACVLYMLTCDNACDRFRLEVETPDVAAKSRRMEDSGCKFALSQPHRLQQLSRYLLGKLVVIFGLA